MSLAATILAAPAGAVTSGQIGEAWGAPGAAEGKFNNPAMLGVDPSDGSVYSGEEKDPSNYRIQKFTAAGAFKAKVEIPRFVKEGASERIAALHGIAVDPVLHRIYVIEGCHLKKPTAPSCKVSSELFGAKRILVYSTEPSGTTLVPASPATLPLPGGEKTIYEPKTIAVDPSNHDLVIFGENVEGHVTVQRISSAGVAGARFVDTGNELRPAGKEATSIAVGPTGTTYTMTGGPSAPGAESTRAWQLPKDLSSLEPVPGFAEAAQSEGWSTGLLVPSTSALIGGPELAVSPDGSTLYWKESLELGAEDTDPSNVLVRGYSLTENATKVLYGNGKNAKKRCRIETAGAGIGTTGEELVVFDYGPGEELTSFGNRVMTFGSGGTECRSPVAKFTVNGSGEEEVAVEKGVSVTFEMSASKAELLEMSPSELEWNFGDGSKETVKGTPPASSIKHTFSSAGTYKVTLRMRLAESESAVTGDPLPVTRAVKVGGGGSLLKLTVAKTGAGFGTVTSSPAGIECGGDCDQEYESGKKVALTPTAAPGSKFTGWSGSCAGTGACEVTMSATKEVNANFDPVTKFKLTTVAGGAGSVTSVPSGIDCRGDCEQEYAEGTVVTLSAHPTPGVGATFTGWTVEGGGSCPGTEACKVTMSAAKKVKADFTSKPVFILKVKKIGTGSGIVASIPSGVLCGEVCEFKFEEGKEVELIQEATLGTSEFIQWGGACSGKTCKVTMSEDREVTAEFKSLVSEFNFKVEKSGPGKVTSTPAGINCGSTCEHKFPSGEVVELKQAAEPGFEFVKWSGDCSGSGACKVTMSEDREVTAEFKLASATEFTLKVKKTGSGKVTSTPSGIDCGSTCEHKFPTGEVVELTQAAEPGSEFVKWGGACAGSGACEVTMSAAKEVIAEFKATPAETKFRLTVAKAGGGSGNVTSTPAGIDCGSTCEAEFGKGKVVSLTQTADSGSEFKEWTGACTGSGACEVTMSAAKKVSASFKLKPVEKVNPPAPPVPGQAQPSSSAPYKAGKAALTLACAGGPCSGTLQLTAKIKLGKKLKNAVIGKASFNLSAGASVLLKVKLSGPAKRELAKGKALKAKVTGTGVASSTVKIKPAPAKKRK